MRMDAYRLVKQECIAYIPSYAKDPVTEASKKATTWVACWRPKIHFLAHINWFVFLYQTNKTKDQIWRSTKHKIEWWQLSSQQVVQKKDIPLEILRHRKATTRGRPPTIALQRNTLAWKGSWLCHPLNTISLQSPPWVPLSYEPWFVCHCNHLFIIRNE